MSLYLKRDFKLRKPFWMVIVDDEFQFVFSAFCAKIGETSVGLFITAVFPFWHRKWNLEEVNNGIIIILYIETCSKSGRDAKYMWDKKYVGI